MTRNLKCTDEHHLFQVRFICQHEACENPLLCCACFQTHNEECPGTYGVHIQEIEGFLEEQVETPLPAKTTMIKREDYVDVHNAKKTNIQERIQKIFHAEITIWRENGEKLDKIEEEIIKYLAKKKESWKKEQEHVLRKMSESIKEGIFPGLEDLKEKLGRMDFESQPFSKNSSAFRELNFKIIPKAEEFINLAEQAMGLWRLNQNRLNDYANTIYKVIDGIEYAGLLHEERLEYKVENFTEISEGLKKLNDEVEDLRKENEVLRSVLNKAENEKESFKGLGSKNDELTQKMNDLENKNKEFGHKVEDLQKALEKVTTEKSESEKKIGELDLKIKSLETDKENMTKVNEEIKKKNGELAAEKGDLSKSVEDLKKTNTDLTAERDKFKTSVGQLTKDKGALETKVTDLTNEVNTL